MLKDKDVILEDNFVGLYDIGISHWFLWKWIQLFELFAL